MYPNIIFNESVKLTIFVFAFLAREVRSRNPVARLPSRVVERSQRKATRRCWRERRKYCASERSITINHQQACRSGVGGEALQYVIARCSLSSNPVRTEGNQSLSKFGRSGF
ncbi:hypothetical protein pipiens_011064 [Culex pipiens pipiens]|uniref:Secreted protein n=1 Tax=Culex pipiens pipiens TaxID=38569 RepID=A0ABD1D9C0_CULPP